MDFIVSSVVCYGIVVTFMLQSDVNFSKKSYYIFTILSIVIVVIWFFVKKYFIL